MSLGHLLFAASMPARVSVGIRFEGRDLVARFGQRARDDRTRVGMPWPRLFGPAR